MNTVVLLVLEVEGALWAVVWLPAQLFHGTHIYIPQGSRNCIQSFLLPLVWKNLMAGPESPVKGWFVSVLEASAFLGYLQNLPTLWALEVVSGGVVVLAGHEEGVEVEVEMVMSYFFQRNVTEMACGTHVDSADLQQHRYSTL